MTCPVYRCVYWSVYRYLQFYTDVSYRVADGRTCMEIRLLLLLIVVVVVVVGV